MESNANKKHKDSVFSRLFSTPEILRELYSAIEGIDVPSDAIVNINTLSEALFMRQINDLSFTINDRIVVLIEHQSTISENIPLRLLMYIGRVYEKIVENRNAYHRKSIKIPTPEFIVLYNGREDCPDHKELRLSTAFKDVSGLKLAASGNLPLELVVQVYNINQGRNSEMLKRSANLNGYSFFIKKVNEFKEQFSLDESVAHAVKYCIENNILKKFLLEQGSEVYNMLFEDLTIEEIAEIRYKEGREEGFEQGREDGLQKGHEIGREEKRTIARNALAKGSAPEFVSEITELSLEEIGKL